jgi:hypothetical protein
MLPGQPLQQQAKKSHFLHLHTTAKMLQQTSALAAAQIAVVVQIWLTMQIWLTWCQQQQQQYQLRKLLALQHKTGMLHSSSLTRQPTLSMLRQVEQYCTAAHDRHPSLGGVCVCVWTESMRGQPANILTTDPGGSYTVTILTAMCCNDTPHAEHQDDMLFSH